MGCTCARTPCGREIPDFGRATLKGLVVARLGVRVQCDSRPWSGYVEGARREQEKPPSFCEIPDVRWATLKERSACPPGVGGREIPDFGRATLKVVLGHDLGGGFLGEIPDFGRATLKGDRLAAAVRSGKGEIPDFGRATLKGC